MMKKMVELSVVRLIAITVKREEKTCVINVMAQVILQRDMKALGMDECILILVSVEKLKLYIAIIEAYV